MNWFTQLMRRKSNQNEPERLAKKLILEEVRRAHMEWTSAQLKLDWVMEQDQIDYAIFALEAAEKRYMMLLKQARTLEWEGENLSIFAAAASNE